MDNIGSWNVRGMNNLTKQLEIKRFLYQNNVGLYGLVETKIKAQDCAWVLNTFGQQWKGVNNIQHHSGGRIWVIWLEQSFNVSIVTMSNQHITARVIENASGNEFLYTVVYGSNDDGERIGLWDELKNIKDKWDGPWSICGDFNNVLEFNERIGRPVQWNEIPNFRDCVDYYEVMDIKAQGAYFTWNNKHEPSSRVFSRIDRFLINAEWMNMYPDSYAYFMPEGLFDHNPCIYYRRMVRQKRPHFRYFNMWGQDPHFKDIIEHHWGKKCLVAGCFKQLSSKKLLNNL